MEGMIFDERCVKLMKRILCLILALLALLSMLPACAPQETVPTQTNGQDLPAQATQAATEPAAATDGAQMDHTVYDISITEVMPDNRNLLLVKRALPSGFSSRERNHVPKTLPSSTKTLEVKPLKMK